MINNLKSIFKKRSLFEMKDWQLIDLFQGILLRTREGVFEEFANICEYNTRTGPHCSKESTKFVLLLWESLKHLSSRKWLS